MTTPITITMPSPTKAFFVFIKAGMWKSVEPAFIKSSPVPISDIAKAIDGTIKNMAPIIIPALDIIRLTPYFVLNRSISSCPDRKQGELCTKKVTVP